MNRVLPLQEWTFDTVLEIVRAKEFEPAEFDYKDVLQGTGDKADEHNRSIRRTVCAMANSGGGHVLFGVKERRYKVTTLMNASWGSPWVLTFASNLAIR